MPFKIKLIRPQKHVMLELIEGGPLQKGVWRRLASDSNSSLQYDSGAWENWTLGSPGGSRNIRLYSPDDTKSCILKEVTATNSFGDAEFLIQEFGGAFGGDPCNWARL